MTPSARLIVTPIALLIAGFLLGDVLGIGSVTGLLIGGAIAIVYVLANLQNTPKGPPPTWPTC